MPPQQQQQQQQQRLSPPAGRPCRAGLPMLRPGLPVRHSAAVGTPQGSQPWWSGSERSAVQRIGATICHKQCGVLGLGTHPSFRLKTRLARRPDETCGCRDQAHKRIVQPASRAAYSPAALTMSCLAGHASLLPQLPPPTGTHTNLIGLGQSLLQLQAQLLRHCGILAALCRQGGLQRSHHVSVLVLQAACTRCTQTQAQCSKHRHHACNV